MSGTPTLREELDRLSNALEAHRALIDQATTPEAVLAIIRGMQCTVNDWRNTTTPEAQGAGETIITCSPHSRIEGIRFDQDHDQLGVRVRATRTVLRQDINYMQAMLEEYTAPPNVSWGEYRRRCTQLDQLRHRATTMKFGERPLPNTWWLLRAMRCEVYAASLMSMIADIPGYLHDYAVDYLTATLDTLTTQHSQGATK